MENQNIEWKESWQDEYLKWICGFANAQGGRLEIGRNDKGALVGLPNAKRLLEELPNKIRATMGIVADVNLLRENGYEYIAVDVAAHTNAISYRGKHYLRSGSTNQELTGFALDELILRKYGRTWDAAPVPRVGAGEFYNDAFDIFRKKAVSSKRLAPEDVDVSNKQILKTLKLVEGEYLLKAALMLFHQDPEEWCFGSQIKIAYFENDADILYQDEIRGPLIGIADRVIDTVYTKYFKGPIRYEGIQRIDDYPMPRNVMREAVLNAVVHKDYSTGNPIHIKIYDGKVVIYNDCRIPSNIPPESLLSGSLGSRPHNPLIAGAFFRSGQIEAWGRGIEKMKNGCVADKLPEPEFTVWPERFSICFHTRSVKNYANGIYSDAMGDNMGDTMGDINETYPATKDVGINDDIGVGINDETSVGINENVGINDEASVGINDDIGVGINNGVGINDETSVGINENVGINDDIGVGINNDVGINDETSVGINKNVGINDETSVGINETREKIMSLMIEKPQITAQQIAGYVGVTKRRIESNIHKLKSLGLIERIGARKNGEWIVKRPTSV